MLTIPGSVSDPVFFAFPFGQEFWFSNGPDMEIHNYLNWDGSSYCDPFEEINNVTKEYFSSKNEFYANNIVDPLNNRYIASTNQDELESYWLDNYVHIGISTSGSAIVLEQNHHVFEATIDPTIPEILSDLGELIVELTTNTSALLPDGTPTTSFEIENTSFDMITLPENTECILHVVAEFENGEEIKEYRYITLFDNTLLYSDFRSFFRGKIINCNASLYEKE